MILDTGNLDAATIKALCDLAAQAYGTNGRNAYKMNVALVAGLLADQIAQAEKIAATVPGHKGPIEIVKDSAA